MPAEARSVVFRTKRITGAADVSNFEPRRRRRRGSVLGLRLSNRERNQGTCWRLLQNFDNHRHLHRRNPGAGPRLSHPRRDHQNFYRDMGPTIFPTTGRLGLSGLFRQLFGTKHSHQDLRNALEQVFARPKIRGVEKPLIIPTYDAIRGRIFLLKTAHHEQFNAGPSMPLRSTSQWRHRPRQPISRPPTSPLMSAPASWTAACGRTVRCSPSSGSCFLGVPLKDIDVLSIGRTASPFNIADNRNAGVKWNVGMINLMFEAQAETAFKARSQLLDDDAPYSASTS